MTLTQPRPEARPMTRRPTSSERPPVKPMPQTAREYAEAWFQCLREPDTHVQPHLPSGGGLGTFVRDLDVGQWRSGGGQVYVQTPAGFRDERAIGRAVYDMLASNRPDDVLYGKLIGRVITGVSIATLLREGGAWHRNRESAMRYALACLTLAVQIGDPVAEHHLARVRDELAQFA